MEGVDLSLVSPSGELKINKLLYDMKGIQTNGLILQIYPPFADIRGEKKKSRFLHSSFSDNNVLAVSDTNGNVFMIDLEAQKYWKIAHKGPVSEISFIPFVKSKILIALKTSVVHIVHIETGNVIGILAGHTAPVRDISYTYHGKYCLTSNSFEAIIWDLMSYSQAYKLSMKDEMSLKQALFIPVQDSIFACFKDDTMNIWKFENFECIKQIIPDGWQTYHLKAVAFTRNGHVMVIGGCTQHILIFCLDTWTIKKCIELPDNMPGIKFMKFIERSYDEGANKILGIVTNCSQMFLIDIESSAVLNNISPIKQLVEHFSVSSTGKYLASIQVSGETEIYLTEKFILPVHKSSDTVEWTSSGSKVNEDGHPVESFNNNATQNLKRQWLEELKVIDDELKEELKLNKLLPILKQFGEYPNSYRVIIWRTVLQLPMNQEAYKSLANRECHPSYVNIELEYPLLNKALSNILKRVLSSLAYWCPLFGEVAFLPELAFPFVKLLHCDPFICFESVATIIVNWYQNWFEFYPFPPINVLSMIENVLGYHDPDLLEFYYEKNVTSSIYACILMQTAFSEVLSKHDWLRLWDHILSNEPSFIFMAVVAFNVICRSAIKKCGSNHHVEDYFHSQQATPVKLLISKTYHLMDKTPSDIHLRRHLSPFSPLKKGMMYVSYEAYPKPILDRNAAKLQLIQKEEQNILVEQHKAIAMKKELDEKLRHDHESDFREQVFAELDEKFREIVNAEEERISAQRRKLKILRQDLKLKELAALEDIREQMLKKRNQKKEIEMERLLKDIESRKVQENEELEALEEEVKGFYSSLLVHKYRLKLEMEMKENEDMKNMYEQLFLKRQKLKQELCELQDELSLSYRDKKIKICKKISDITDTLKKIGAELENECMEEKADVTLERSDGSEDKFLSDTENLEMKLNGLLKEGGNPHAKHYTMQRNEVVNDPAFGSEKILTSVRETKPYATHPWFFERTKEEIPMKFRPFDMEKEEKQTVGGVGNWQLCYEKYENKNDDCGNGKISRDQLKCGKGRGRAGKKHQFRTKFTQCCCTPSSALSSENKLSEPSECDSDKDYISPKGVTYRKLRKSVNGGCTKEQGDCQQLQNENLTGDLSVD